MELSRKRLSAEDNDEISKTVKRKYNVESRKNTNILALQTHGQIRRELLNKTAKMDPFPHLLA